jgi:hypothetical protein
MSGATVGLAVVLATLAGTGLVSQAGLEALLNMNCLPWCMVMFVLMLFRLDMYTRTNRPSAIVASGTPPRAAPLGEELARGRHVRVVWRGGEDATGPPDVPTRRNRAPSTSASPPGSVIEIRRPAGQRGRRRRP